MNNALTNLAPDLWIATRSFTNELGVVTSRMTVIRLEDGRILVHSPVPIEPDLRSAVENLGQVAALIAPNLFHHQFISEWRAAFPEAKAFCAPGLAAKRSDFKFDGVLEDVSSLEWRGQVDQLLIKGIPDYSEVVFFHRTSRTLMVSDLVFNYSTVQAESDPGGADGLGPHSRIRSAISDPDALRESIESVLRWPLDRVIVSHGEIVESDGHARFREGFAFLEHSRRSRATTSARPAKC
jgi:glyoxylase-like metal-dependent hydrolase (beta-lactamase superfamily II)